MADIASDLIARIKRNGSFPDDDTLFQTADYIQFINDCLEEEVYPDMIKMRDRYSIIRDVLPLQTSSAQDIYPTGIIPIPKRAWGNTLQEVRYYDVSGNPYKMSLVPLENRDLYMSRTTGSCGTYGKMFFFFNNGIQVMPFTVGDPGFIELQYIAQPSTIESTGTAYSDINNLVYTPTSGNSGYITYTTTTVGATFNAYCSIGQIGLFDIYNSQTGMLLHLNRPMMRSSANTFVDTVTSLSPNNLNPYPNPFEITSLQTGGYPVIAPYTNEIYLVPAGINSFSTVLPEFDDWLCYCVVCKMLKAQGYVEELQVLQAERDAKWKRLASTIAHRIDGEAQVLNPIRGLRNTVMAGAVNRRRVW
jgi:hypothetical protein